MAVSFEWEKRCKGPSVEDRQSNTPSVRSQMDSVKEFRDGLWPNEQWGSNLSKALNQLIASSC